MRKTKKPSAPSAVPVAGHETTVLTEQRQHSATVCAHDGCAFRGKAAQQGVCFSDEGVIAEFDKLDEHEREIRAELADMKKREGKQYVRALEANQRHELADLARRGRSPASRHRAPEGARA